MADQGNTASDDSTGDRREMTDWHGGVSGGQPPQLAQDVKSSQHGTAATDEALPFGQGRLHLVLLLVFDHVPFFLGFSSFFFSVTETVAEQECCLCTADDWHVRHNGSLELSCMQMHIHAAHPCSTSMPMLHITRPPASPIRAPMEAPLVSYGHRLGKGVHLRAVYSTFYRACPLLARQGNSSAHCSWYTRTTYTLLYADYRTCVLTTPT